MARPGPRAGAATLLLVALLVGCASSDPGPTRTDAGPRATTTTRPTDPYVAALDRGLGDTGLIPGGAELRRCMRAALLDRVGAAQFQRAGVSTEDLAAGGERLITAITEVLPITDLRTISIDCQEQALRSARHSIAMVGDSLLDSVTNLRFDEFDASAPDGYRVAIDVLSGSHTAAHTDFVTTLGRADRPDRLVVELGINDVNVGWDDATTAAYATLVAAAPPRTCVVVVLPWKATASGGSGAASLERARDAIQRIADGVEHHVVIDFASFAADHPTWIDPDGIHLRTNDASVRDALLAGYQRWIWTAVNGCTEDEP